MDIQGAIESIPGFSVGQFIGEEYAEEHFQTKNPYEDKDGNRRKLPPTALKQRQKLWRRVQKKSWKHDKCFLGSCGVGLDCGVGLVPIVVGLFPVLGPLVMYVMHNKIINMVEKEVQVPMKLQTKLQLNVAFDLLITFPPVIGLFFGWINKCSTRNASLIYDYLCLLEHQKLKSAGYRGRGAIVDEELFGYQPPAQPRYIQDDQQNVHSQPPSYHHGQQPVYQSLQQSYRSQLASRNEWTQPSQWNEWQTTNNPQLGDTYYDPPPVPPVARTRQKARAPSRGIEVGDQEMGWV